MLVNMMVEFTKLCGYRFEEEALRKQNNTNMAPASEEDEDKVNCYGRM
jgi:hypothetical protein